MDVEQEIRRYYGTLLSKWGPQNWWPAQSRFEVIVGAYLTQNTAWTNVERVITSLRTARVLSVAGIREIAVADLENLVRSAGYFRQKARRLKTFVAYLDASYSGSLARMFREPTQKLRAELLALNGVGFETADSILLYAGNHPVFVVDAYTRRIVQRHGILPDTAHYEEVRELFQRALSSARGETVSPRCQSGDASHAPSRISMCSRTPLAQRFNEMHALIVGVGKNYCFRPNPDCESCPLSSFLTRKA